LPTKGSFKKKYGIGINEKIVLYLGRIHQLKGIDILVKAFANIADKLHNVRLVIVGPDDGYLGEIRALVKTLRITSKVLIIGPLFCEEKLEAYVDADVYVLPSRYEIFGMSILEAVACGTPLILTETCGIAEYFRDKTGMVVPPIPKKIEEALLNILQDTILSNVFRTNCLNLRGTFDISKTVLTLEEIYADAIDNNVGICI
jgi:glycosyltransferase involved in cell wall biosynthesis